MESPNFCLKICLLIACATFVITEISSDFTSVNTFTLAILPSSLLATSTCTTSGQYNFHDFRSRPLPNYFPSINLITFIISFSHVRGWKLLTQFLASSSTLTFLLFFMTLRQSKIILSFQNYCTLSHHVFTFTSTVPSPGTLKDGRLKLVLEYRN